MNRAARSRLFTIGCLLLAVVALLAIGALKQRQDMLTRGLIEGLPEPIPKGGARLGLNVYLERYDEDALRANLSAIRRIGVQTLKQPFFFSETFDWTASDRLLATVGEQELNLVPLLDGDPATGFAPPADPSAFADWAGEFARRYGEQIHYYIVWDEPNLTSHWGNQPVNPAEYAALLAAAAQAIRAADAEAIIVAAPLAPTEETGPSNLSEPLFLQRLYEAGARDSFDIVAGKPYGFDTSPEDRAVSQDRLNFSRIILLREVMERNGDGHKAVWAGNWGWNSLPADWSGKPSIWGQTSEAAQAARTVAALERAQQEWPWMGLMFLENWEPNAEGTDSRWGFSVASRQAADELETFLREPAGSAALPGFHLADPADPSQIYEGSWRFSPDYGADIGESGDRVTFTFWGSDVGLRVRRADFRARLYVTVDGEPANALPSDENGSMLILTAPSRFEDYVSTEWVARDLSPGRHTLRAVASRGWDQWALNGFSVGYWPPDRGNRWASIGLGVTAVMALFAAAYQGRRAEWAESSERLKHVFDRLSEGQQLVFTGVTAVIVALAGWFTWGEQASGLYRRLGDGSQLALTAAAASIFYVTPAFLVYAVALVLLFLLIYLRPAWGVALVAFSIPLYVLPKPMVSYRFSPLEIFTLVTFAAFLLARVTAFGARQKMLADQSKGQIENISSEVSGFSLRPADYGVVAFTLVATLSLLFTERLDVATNEWRVVIVEPALLYLLLRSLKIKEREMWTILDAFVLGGLLVALYGLWQYAAGVNLITAESGLMRLRSIYGSPNNVGLFLGRVFPLLAAVALIGRVAARRRWAYAVFLLPVSLALLLSFSRGALFLGIPAASLYIFWRWQRDAGRPTWPWLLGFAILGTAAILAAQQIPALAGRLDLRGATSVFRVNLWRASLNMIADHPWFGVGLDNFLYAYRGRYIFDAAWQEPNLSHPHNLWLDFAARLGFLGLIAGIWMIVALYRILRHIDRRVPAAWWPVVVGLGAALADMVAHGLVDHGFFLVDLAFAFYLMMGMALWLQRGHEAGVQGPTMRNLRP